MSEYSVDEVRARFEVHHGISWESIQTMHIGSGSRLHLESHYKRHFETWQAAYAERIEANERAVTDEVVQKVADELDELFAVEDAQEPAFLNDVRRILTSVWPNPTAQSAQSVDVEKVLEVIAELSLSDWPVLMEAVKKLTAALQEKAE